MREKWLKHIFFIPWSTLWKDKVQVVLYKSMHLKWTLIYLYTKKMVSIFFKCLVKLFVKCLVKYFKVKLFSVSFNLWPKYYEIFSRTLFTLVLRIQLYKLKICLFVVFFFLVVNYSCIFSYVYHPFYSS